MKRSSDDEVFAELWRANRSYLVDLAFRMLGDVGAAEDVVQEAYSRLLRATPDDIGDARGWLTVVTSRLCLDQIKSARSRHERTDSLAVFESNHADPRAMDPADRITLDDNVRLALLVVLERLSPAERVVFVLHDIFQVPFDVVAETVGRTGASCRQLARRARLKMEAADAVQPQDLTDAAKYQMITERFIAACATGDLDDLLAVLDPQASGTIDTRPHVVVVGADRVARNLIRFWSAPTTTLVSQPIGGQPAVLAFSERDVVGMLLLTIAESRITEVHVVAEAPVLDDVRAQLSRVGVTP
jgi:RNA polymerase sigma-70 factor (ECF subfamily)